MGKQWTNKDYMKFVEDETVGFRVIGKYVNNSTKVLMYHEDCGREFESIA